MDILNSIASWSGWASIVPILLLIGGLGSWLYKQRLDFLKDEVESLNRKLQECLNFTPDLVARRLAERHKLLLNELEVLNQDKENNDKRIVELEKELLETNSNADYMALQLEQAQEILGDFNLPRSGKVSPIILQDILSTTIQQSAIYFPVSMNNVIDDESINNLRDSNPFSVEIEFPGMSKMYLNVYDKSNNFIGHVFNPYLEFYYKDYYETLLEILRLAPKELIPLGMENLSERWILTTSGFHSKSPINPSIIYLKVPGNASMFAKG